VLLLYSVFVTYTACDFTDENKNDVIEGDSFDNEDITVDSTMEVQSRVKIPMLHTYFSPNHII